MDPQRHHDRPTVKRRRLESGLGSRFHDTLQSRPDQARHPGNIHHLGRKTSRHAPQLTKDALLPSDLPIGLNNDAEDELSRALAKFRKTYERQRRRKTRADKYDPKMKESPSKPHHPKEIKKAKQSNPAFKFDFKAPNVAQNRLTVRPKIPPGPYLC